MKVSPSGNTRAHRTFLEHTQAMHKIAKELLREETIPGERVRAILRETNSVQKSQEG